MALAELERRVAAALKEAQRAEFAMFLVSVVTGTYEPTEAAAQRWRVDLESGLRWDPRFNEILGDFRTAAHEYAVTRAWLVHSALIDELGEATPATLFERLDRFMETCELITSQGADVAERALLERGRGDGDDFLAAVQRAWHSAG